MGGAVSHMFRKEVEFVDASKFQHKKQQDTRRRNSLLANMIEWEVVQTDATERTLAMGKVQKYWRLQAKNDADNYDPVLLKMLKGPILVEQGDMRRLRHLVVHKWKDINRSFQGPMLGDSLLHVVCREGYAEMLRFMADPKTKSVFETVTLDANLENSRKRTPLMVCFTPPHFTHMARDFGLEEDAETGVAMPKATKPEAMVNEGDWVKPGGRKEREEIARMLITDLKADPHKLDMHSYSCLHYAAIRGWEDTVELLLEQKVEIEHQCLSGENALHFAVQNRHGAVAEILLDALPSLVNVTDEEGGRAIHMAVKNGHKEMVLMLLDWDVDLNTPNHKHFTPLMTACDRQDWEMASLLLDVGASKDEEAFKLLKGDSETKIRAKLRRMELEELRKLQELKNSSNEADRLRAEKAYGAWVPYLDKFGRGIFYYNKVSRLSQWEVPADYHMNKSHIMKPATFGMHFYH